MTALPAPGAELLCTERLVLRRFAAGDVSSYFEMMNQPRIEATLMPGPSSLEAAERQLAMMEGMWALRGMSMLAVVEKSTRLLVGQVGPWCPHGWPQPEIGWTIHPRRHRRGYAVEAARAAGRWLLTARPDLGEVIHLITHTNTSSQRTAARLGAVKTGKVFHHPVGGALEIWSTPRSALVFD